jgi:acylphosphatase
VPEIEAAVRVRVAGRVQGVGFRYFAQRTGLEAGLTGWVRNLPDGQVEAEAEGPRGALERWLEDLRQGPTLSRVDTLAVEWKKPSKNFKNFSVKM